MSDFFIEDVWIHLMSIVNQTVPVKVMSLSQKDVPPFFKRFFYFTCLCCFCHVYSFYFYLCHMIFYYFALLTYIDSSIVLFY